MFGGIVGPDQLCRFSGISHVVFKAIYSKAFLVDLRREGLELKVQTTLTAGKLMELRPTTRNEVVVDFVDHGLVVVDYIPRFFMVTLSLQEPRWSVNTSGKPAEYRRLRG